ALLKSSRGRYNIVVIRTLLSLAMVGVCGFALAQGRFQRESEDFPAGNQATRRIIDVGGCKETGEVSKLSLMKVGPLGRSLAALIVTRVQVKFENQAQPETVLEGD